MFTTVVICTYNRSKLLNETMAQLRHLNTVDCGDWEILVVNNNCSDDTDAVIQRHVGALPVRRLWEPQPGKSYAANLAVREAKGDLVLWIDDDVLVDREWLNAYVEAARLYPEVSFFGGPIVPWFESEPPEWLVRHLPLISGCFATRTAFEEPVTPISARYLPFGANMGMRRRCLEDSCFDINLGPVGRTNYQDEDVVLLQKLLDRGMQGLWIKKAGVQHFIPAERLAERYIWRFHSCIGRTRVRRGEEVTRGKEIFGVPRWLVRKYLDTLAICKLWSPAKNERWLRAFQRAAVYRGMISECRDRSRATRADAFPKR